MGKILKENWFVVVIAVFFIGVSIYFIYDQNRDILPGETTNGKDVVFSVDDTLVTADEVYDELSKTYGETEIFLAFRDMVLDEAIETTDDLEDEVQEQVDNTVTVYEYYGYSEEYLDSFVQYYYGYDTFYDYVMYSEKLTALERQYINDNQDTVYTDEIEETLNGRIVSYVVISMDDPENPTEDESTKLQEAQEAWASEDYSADTFADFATAYSQDSNASSGGVLGYVSSTTDDIDEAFLEVALELEVGEVSDWVYSEEYGYYLIKVDSVSFEDLIEEDDFVIDVIDQYDNLASEIIWETAQDLGVSFSEFNGESIEDFIKENLGIEDDDTTDNSEEAEEEAE